MKHAVPVEIKIRTFTEKSSKYKYSGSISWKRCENLQNWEEEAGLCSFKRKQAGWFWWYPDHDLDPVLPRVWWRGGWVSAVLYFTMLIAIWHASQAWKPWTKVISVRYLNSYEMKWQVTWPGAAAFIPSKKSPLYLRRSANIKTSYSWGISGGIQQTHMWSPVFVIPGWLLQPVIGFPACSSIKDKSCLRAQQIWLWLLSVLLWHRSKLKFTPSLSVSTSWHTYLTEDLFRFSQVQ